MEINKIYNENCLDTMAKMPDNFIDLVVTSPPYDNLRDYKGYVFPFKDIAKELFRVVKKGGVVVWVVGDATISGSETGTSFKQALYFKEIGFNLHDTMIWAKDSYSFPEKNRYPQTFEYMFILSKSAPTCVNKIQDRINIWAGTKMHGTSRGKDGKTTEKANHNKSNINFYGDRLNVWNVTPEKNNTFNHPAPFPEKLAQDHIKTWSIEGDLVYDCFMGSGTTAKMAHLLKRNWIGSEMSSEYCDIANKRIETYLQQQTIF
jgi:site-specific DNA-methyltransferase (adenine-specific)